MFRLLFELNRGVPNGTLRGVRGRRNSSLLDFQEENMQKKEQSSRQVVVGYLMDVMSVDIEEANHLVSSLEHEGLVCFESNGDVTVLVLEGQS